MDDHNENSGILKSKPRNHIKLDKQKNMPAHKAGKLWRLDMNEVDEWIKTGGAAADKQLKILRVVSHIVSYTD